jgi:hypothetical protein
MRDSQPPTHTKTRREYFHECWKRAKHHWIAVVVAVLVALYYIIIDWGPLLKLPHALQPEGWFKLPLSWALTIIVSAFLYISVEGGRRLHHDTITFYKKELETLKENHASEVGGLLEKVANLPRPKIAVSWVLSGRPAFGHPVTLQDASFTNVGNESAHEVWIIPDKTKKYWLEQSHPIDMLRPGEPPVFPALRAVERKSDGTEQRLFSQDDPVRLIAGVLVLGDFEQSPAEPELLFSIEYFSFGRKARYVSKYRVTLAAGNPSFQSLED